MFDELAKKLRSDADYMDANGIMLYASSEVYRQAADAIDELNLCGDGIAADNDSLCKKIEELRAKITAEHDLRVKALNRLCEWCGICPKEKWNAEDCEIAMIGPEYTEPPKEAE